MIKAIIFDLFETLVTEANSVKMTSFKIAEMLKVPYDEYKKLVSGLRNSRYRGDYPNFSDVLIYVFTTLDLHYDIDLIKSIAAERETCKSQCFCNISNEIIYMLNELKKRNLKLILVSNASREEIKEFYNCKLAAYFDEVIFSYEIGYIKPEPEIYNEACNRIGVMPENCIFIGDGGSNELTGAENIGMKAYCANWFISLLGYKPPNGFKVLQTPSEVLSIVDSYM